MKKMWEKLIWVYDISSNNEQNALKYVSQKCMVLKFGLFKKP